MRVLILLFIFLPSSLYAFWPLSWELGNEKRFLGPLVSYDEHDESAILSFARFWRHMIPKKAGQLDYLYPLGKVIAGQIVSYPDLFGEPK